MERGFLTRERESLTSEKDVFRKRWSITSDQFSVGLFPPSIGNSQAFFQRSQDTAYLDTHWTLCSELIHSLFSLLAPPLLFMKCLFCVRHCVLDTVPDALTAREFWWRGKHTAPVTRLGLLLTRFAKFLNVTGFLSPVNKCKCLDHWLQTALQSQTSPQRPDHLGGDEEGEEEDVLNR